MHQAQASATHLAPRRAKRSPAGVADAGIYRRSPPLEALAPCRRLVELGKLLTSEAELEVFASRLP
jgi:hypothetical protein